MTKDDLARLRVAIATARREAAKTRSSIVSLRKRLHSLEEWIRSAERNLVKNAPETKGSAK